MVSGCLFIPESKLLEHIFPQLQYLFFSLVQVRWNDLVFVPFLLFLRLLFVSFTYTHI